MAQSQPTSTINADVITLDNILNKLPQWNPDSANQRFCLVDCGSNGIRFSVSDLSQPNARLLPCLFQDRAAISLLDALMEGKEMYGDERFPPATIALVAKTMAGFRQKAVEGYGVDPSNIMIFATEAMRRAVNAAEMLQAIGEACPDLTIHVAEPLVETLLGGMGARSGQYKFKGLCVDLGGGSLQMSWFNTDDAVRRASTISHSSEYGHDQDNNPADHYGIAAARAGQSLPFGAARLIHILNKESSDVQAAEVNSYHERLAGVFAKLCSTYPDLAAASADGGPGVNMFVYGGGLRGYGNMLLFNDPIQPYPFSEVGSYTVSGAYFSEVDKMAKVNKKHKGKIPGMSSRRRDQFEAITTVVNGILAVVPNIRKVTFCAGGNREGALMMTLPESIRESNPLALLDSGPSDPITASIIPDNDAVDSYVAKLSQTVPDSLATEDPEPATIFSLGLAELFVRSLWTGKRDTSSDDPSENNTHNASAAMHHALIRDPGVPCLGHLERAVLAVTSVARWGGSVKHKDHDLYKSLREVVAANDDPSTSKTGQVHYKAKDSRSLYWADFIGQAAAAVAKEAELGGLDASSA